MSRKSLLLAVGIVVVLVFGGGTILVSLARYEPEFYRRAAMPEGEPRKQRSSEFRRELYELLNGIIGYKTWGAKFTDEQINSYFEEDFLRSGNVERTFFPEGVNGPRVAIDSNRIRLGMRYGSGWWSTVLSLDLRVWLVAKEPNVVAVEIERIRYGALPISAQGMIERLAESARRQDIEVSWFRHDGKRVALLRFQPGRRDPTVQLLRLDLQPGLMTINGADRSKPSGGDADASASSLAPIGN